MNAIAIILLIVNLFSPYIGSWLPSIGGSPAGGVVRDLIIVLFAAAVFLTGSKPLLKTYLESLYVIVYSFLLIWMVTDSFMTSVPISSAILGARNIMLFPLVGFLFFIGINNGLIRPESVSRCLYVLGATASLLGILDVVTEGAILTSLGYRPDYVGGGLFNLVVEYLGIRRATGGFSDALNYGYTMALFAIYFLYELFKCKHLSSYKRFFHICLIIISSIATVLTLTRGAIIVLVLGFITFAASMATFKNKMYILALFFIAVVSISFSDYGELFYGRFTDSETNSAESSQTRIEMATNSLRVISEEPFGIGLGSQGAGAQYSNDDNRVNTDNYFLWIAVESGLIGLLLTLAVGAINFSICFLHMKVMKISSIYFFYLVTAYFVTGMLSSAPISPLYAITFWVMLNIEAANMFALYPRHSWPGNGLRGPDPTGVIDTVPQLI